MNAELSAEQETSRIIQFFSGLSLSAFEKFKCPGGCPGVMLNLQFDGYIIIILPQLFYNFFTIFIIKTYQKYYCPTGGASKKK